MRGKALVEDIKAGLYGITPAYAGKSGGALTGAIPAQDHPRVCGEKGLGALKR